MHDGEVNLLAIQLVTHERMNKQLIEFVLKLSLQF